MDDKNITYQYIGRGQFIAGVPTRNLTQREWNALEQWQRQAAIQAGLYQIITKEDKKNG